MPLGRTGEKAAPCAMSGGTWLSHDVEGDEEDGELGLGEPGEEHLRVREDWTDNWLQLNNVSCLDMLTHVDLVGHATPLVLLTLLLKLYYH